MKKSRSILLFFVGLLLALNVFCWQEVFDLTESKPLKVVFFDVGQGDSAFIETPEGHQIVIDGGPNATVLEKLGQQMPFWDKSIDLIILTHPEKDHMTGLLSLLERYYVDYFLWTEIIKNDAQNEKLAQLLEKAQKPKNNFLASFLPMGKKLAVTKVVSAHFGQKIKAGNSLIDILYPFENLSGQEPKNTNDTSVVVKLIFGKSEFLFTGDIGFSVERRLVGEVLDADVLKVAHHGSKYSSSEEFLYAVSPELAIISSGKNSYGHPTPEVLERLSDVGAEVLRIDQKGDITILSDGSKIYIK